MEQSDDFYAGRTVLVTGGTGFVGRHLVEALHRKAARVRVPLHRRPLPADLGYVEAVRADLSSEDECARVLDGVDYVFHAAGVSAGAGVGAGGVMSSIVTNLVLTARVLDAVFKQRVERCLVFSSSTVYPDVAHAVTEDEAWSGPPHEAYFGYGWMRRYFERLGQFVQAKSETQVAIVRPTAVYGRHDNFDPSTSHFVPALIRRAVERRVPYEVWGTGDEFRDLLHVTDLAQGCLLALEKYACGDPVNIGAGQVVSVADVVNCVLDAASHHVQPVFTGTLAQAIRGRRIDCTKARREFGFVPTVTLADGLSDTVRWYQTSVLGRGPVGEAAPAGQRNWGK